MSDNSQDKTIETYRENFSKYREKTPPIVDGVFQSWIDLFCSFLPAGASIFELGSAVGRDARYIRSKGFKLLCTDVVPEALKQLKEEGFDTDYFDFRDEPKNEWLEKFEGVFASAVLLHATSEEFNKSLDSIFQMLKDSGVAAISLKTNEVQEEITNEKMDAPRFFRYYTKEELEKILENFKFEILSLTTADNGKWLHLILRKNESNK